MSKTLDEIRKKIDSIDNQVHDLLMERAGLVSGVAQAKKENGLQIVQPAREARMMRRLLSRHAGPLPRATIIRIWRELVGSVALLQSGFSVVVADDCSGWDVAKDYFGSSVPMKNVPNSQNAVSEVLKDESSFAILPWPELDDPKPWWSVLLSHQGERRLSIICALPYGREADIERALVVSKINFMPSDDDVSFVALDVEGDMSRARIVEKAEGAGFDVLNLYRGSAHYLLEVQGFYDESSEDVSKFQELLGEQCVYCTVVGGYPVIPDIETQENTQNDAA